MKTKTTIIIFLVISAIINLKAQSPSGTFMDARDGQTYNWVKIGSQIWMANNLRAIKYTDGTAIPNVTSYGEWSNLTTGAYSWYDNDSTTNAAIYGTLYNWYTVETEKLCPTGWHIPTDDEWKQLEMYLGMSESEANNTGDRGTNEGSKLAGYESLWIDGNLDSDVEFDNSGFKAKPSGYRVHSTAAYVSKGANFNIWTNTEYDNEHCWIRELNSGYKSINRSNQYKTYGFSVRCLYNDTTWNTLNDSLIAYYPFTNGSTADSSGKGNNGNNYDATPTSDRFENYNEAFHFNGIDNFINIPKTIQGKAKIAYNIWAQLLNKSDFNMIMSHEGVFSIGCGDGIGKLGGFIDLSGNIRKLIEPDFYVDNTWHMYTLTYNGELISFYIDNVLKDTVYGTGVVDTDFSNSWQQFIGRWNSSGYFWNGKIDDIRIYNRALSKSEISQLYANYHGPDTLIAEAGNEQITLRWGSERIAGLSKYNIYRDSVLHDSVKISAPDDTVYTDINLTNYQTYQYYITSVDTYGNESQPSDTISIFPCEIITDIDGNTYTTTKIGEQIWMAENLAATKYADETAIPLITNNTEWANLDDNNTDKAYSYYNNNANEEAYTYGALYTFAAATNGDTSSANPSGVQGVCPDGWHIPSVSEWDELINYIGENGFLHTEGRVLKSSSGWNDNGNGTNYFGFSATPGGLRYHDNRNFGYIGSSCYFWTSTEINDNIAIRQLLISADSSILQNNNYKSMGFSVRCLKNISCTPQLKLSEYWHEFGNIMQNSILTDTIYIYNTGCNTLKIHHPISSNSDILPMLEFNTPDSTILPSDSGLLFIQINPSEIRSYYDTIYFSSNVKDTFIIITANSYPELLPPNTLTAEADNQQITLRWSSELIKGLNNYYIYRDDSLHDSVEVTLNYNDTIYTDVNLTNYQTYEYFIRSVDTLGVLSQPSDTISIFPCEIITDIDGNIYTTTKIGEQIWMAENLKTTKYSDDTDIPNVTNNTTWNGLSTPAYCWYDNEVDNKTTYGAMYNWFAVETGKLCPTGWHIPTDLEWAQLETYAGGSSLAGGKLKEVDTLHWNNPNTDASDDYNFTALPGGTRGDNGSFYYLGTNGTWWSSTEYNSANSRTFNLFNNSANSSIIQHQKNIGFSVRCLKNNNQIDSLTISPDSLQFGNQLINSGDTIQTIKLKNISSVNKIIITSLSGLNKPFTIAPLTNDTIKPNDSITLSITLNTDTLVNNYIDTLIIKTTNTDTFVIVTASIISNTPPMPPKAIDTAACQNDTIWKITAIGENLKWYSSPGRTNFIEATDSLQIMKSITGTYTYYVTQTVNGIESYEDTLTVLIYAPTVTSFVPTNVSECNKSDGIVEIIATGFPPIKYSIDNGENFTENNVFESLKEDIYSFIIKDGYNCESILNVRINTEKPLAPEICNIEIYNEKNRIYFESNIQSSVEKIYIYKTISNENNYSVFDSILTSNSYPNNFTDNNSIPDSFYYSYKLQTKDECGNFSLFNTAHQTISLTIFEGHNLGWNEYTGNDLNEYEIYRGTSESNLTLYESVSNMSWSDQNPLPGITYYQVAAVFESNLSSFCNLSDNLANKYFSNIVNDGVLKVSQFDKNSFVTIYPNPAKNTLNIELETPSNNLQIDISDITGAKIFSCQYSEIKSLNIDVKNLPEGFYVINVKTYKYQLKKKILIKK